LKVSPASIQKATSNARNALKALIKSNVHKLNRRLPLVAVKAYQDTPKQGKYTKIGNRWQPLAVDFGNRFDRFPTSGVLPWLCGQASAPATFRW
jgi:hypothetical protein